MRVVEERELREHIGEAEALAAVEAAFRALSENRVEQPAPMGFDFPEARGEVHVKGAAIRGAGVFAVKIASGFYDNPSRGLPTGSGLVLVLDAATGHPLALFRDNAYLTEMRTAAAGALSARLLAPSKIERLAVIGSGSQARYQLRALSRVRDIASVAVWSPSSERRRRYRDEMARELDVEIRAEASAKQAADGADVLLTVTPAREPVLRSEWVRDDATILAVGSDGADKQELEAELVARADKLVCDSVPQCARLGELHHALEAGLLDERDVHAELSGVVAGNASGREGRELIVCDLTGVGAQDAAIAELAWSRLAP